MKHVPTPLGEPVELLETGLAVQQRDRQTALSNLARLRKKASAEIERLIAFLDQSDPYVMTELEDDISSDLEDPGDDEPSLGSLGRATDQTRWGGSGWSDRDAIDREQDHGDDEPSLGWTDEEPVQGVYAGATPRTADIEEQCEDEGVSA